MSLIIRSGDNRKQTNKQAYTWAACIMVAVFLVSIAVPFLGTKKEKAGQDYMEKAYDLAQLPFVNDQATDALLQADRYKDVAKKDLLGTLFSKEDKAKRQAEDKVNGTPAAPDEEYKQAEVQKANIEARRAAAAQRTQATGTVTPGSLRAGSMASGGGASSGVSANIWRSDDKDGSKNRGSSTGSAMDGNKAQLLASIKSGRGTGFVDATLQSSAAAKNKNLDAAAAGAVNAFQKGAQEKTAELKTDLEKQAEGLNLDPGAEENKLAASNIPALDDATEKIEQKKKEKDAEECKFMFSSLKCALSMIGEKVLGMVTGAGESALKSKWGADDDKGGKDGKDGKK